MGAGVVEALQESVTIILSLCLEKWLPAPELPLALQEIYTKSIAVHSSAMDI